MFLPSMKKVHVFYKFMKFLKIFVAGKKYIMFEG